jgi:hypothetical protein
VPLNVVCGDCIFVIHLQFVRSSLYAILLTLYDLKVRDSRGNSTIRKVFFSGLHKADVLLFKTPRYQGSQHHLKSQQRPPAIASGRRKIQLSRQPALRAISSSRVARTLVIDDNCINLNLMMTFLKSV